MPERARYGRFVLFFTLLALAAAGGILAGEFTGRTLAAGGMIGLLLVAYSFVILFLRKAGLIGGR